MEIISGKPDGGREGISAAHPVPELEHVFRVYAEASSLPPRWSTARRNAGELPFPTTSCSTSHFLAVSALVMVSWVVKVFDAMMKSVSSGSHRAEGFHDMGIVDIRYKIRIQIPPGIEFQGLRRHAGSQVRPADADIHDILHRPAGDSLSTCRPGPGRKNPSFYPGPP